MRSSFPESDGPLSYLAGYLGQFLPVGVFLTGCGILIAMAGLFGWFAILGSATAQP
jgi:hypothetical protein